MFRYGTIAVLCITAATVLLAITSKRETAIVRITNEGFIPSEITIKKGVVVQFRNETTEDHWPASDPHPTHHFFIAFDPRNPIPPNQSWKMTFAQAGDFRFHDHLYPHTRGVIHVSGISKISSSEEIFDSLTSLPAKISYPFRHAFDTKVQPTTTPVELKTLNPQAQYAYLEQYLTQNGSQATWQLVRDTFRNDAGFVGNIHDIAHYVGGLLYTKEGFLGLAICTPDFGFGCFHGFLDVAFRNDLSKLPEAISGCAQLGAQGPYASCIHGIGHGVASFYLVQDLNSSLKTCDNIVNGAQFCYDGVFMEFSRNAAQAFYKSDDHLFPCNTLDEKYVSACGRNLPNVLMGRFAMPLAKAANVCIEATIEAIRAPCVDAIGFIAASQSLGDAGKILAACRTISDDQYYARCAEKAAGELIFQNYPSWKQASYAVCNALAPSYQQSCTQYLQVIKDQYGRN